MKFRAEKSFITKLETTAKAAAQAKSGDQEMISGGVGPSSTGLQFMIDNSPRMTAQRRKLDGLLGSPVQRQGVEDEELLQGKFIQRKPEEEEELLQGKFKTVQRQPEEEEELLQGKFYSKPTETMQMKEAAPENNTGLPDSLKSGLENLSGMSMDAVRVNYNSPKPAELNAHAYTQGTDIHVASGQERHLPHEGWHVVQQMQGRVQPTMQMQGGVNINDDAGLEKEADVMGGKALQLVTHGSEQVYPSSVIHDVVIQPKWLDFGIGEDLVWDQIPDGLRWFLERNTGKLYFHIEVDHRSPIELWEEIEPLEGQLKSLEEWISTGIFEHGRWTDEDTHVEPGVVRKEGQRWLEVYEPEIKSALGSMQKEYTTKNKRKDVDIPASDWDFVCSQIEKYLKIEPKALGGLECMNLIDELLTPLEQKYLGRAQFTTSRNFLAEICVAKSYWMNKGILKPWSGGKGNKQKTPDYHYDPAETGAKEYADTFIVKPNENTEQIYGTIRNTIEHKANKYIGSGHQPFTAIVNITLVHESISIESLIGQIKSLLSDEKYAQTKVELLLGDKKIQAK